MNNETKEFTNSKIQYIDQQQLKILAGTIRKFIIELKTIKKKSDIVWEQCSAYLEDNTIKNINSVKSDNAIKFAAAIEDLNNYANKIESIANIWEDTENEIKTSSKNLESLFDDIGKTMRSAIEYSKKQ